jgi:predicted NBD/HSP70 family sugar kinase
MDDSSGKAATTIAELAGRIAGKGKLVGGATQAEVLWQIAQHAGVAARGDIATNAALSTATVSKAVAILIREKLVDDGVEQGQRKPGAPLRWAERYAAAGVVITTRDGHPVEFLGTVTTLDGKPLPAFAGGAKREPITSVAQKESDPQGVLDELGVFIKGLLQEAASRSPAARVLGCGVSVGGHVDGGIVRKSFNTGWKDDFDLKTALAEWLKREGLPLDVVVENDVTSDAVLMNLTSAPAKSYVLVAMFRDGVGGAVVVKGRTWRGSHGLAGEIGHIYVGSRGGNGKSLLDRGEEPRCRCGQVGCLEAFATPLAMFSRAHPERGDGLTCGEQAFKELFTKLASRPQTDTEVTDIFREGGTALARGLAAVILWLDPEMIFLYLPPALAEENPFLNAGKSYLDAVHAELSHIFSIGDTTPLIIFPKTELQLEELGAEAAASTVLRQLLVELEDIK